MLGSLYGWQDRGKLPRRLSEYSLMRRAIARSLRLAWEKGEAEEENTLLSVLQPNAVADRLR
jgi:hypothetical protein